MLRPLIYLCALIGLAGAQVSFTVPAVLDISSCPICFYGRTYRTLYVNFSRDQFSLCFNGFFSPQTGSDCIMGPPVDRDGGTYRIWFPHQEGYEINNLISPVSIDLEHECELKMSGYSNTESDVIIANYRTQTTLSFYMDSSRSHVFQTLVDGKTVDTLTFTSRNGLYVQQAFDISGCRHSGKVYKRDGVGSEPDTCSSVTCDQTAVLSVTGCGPLERCLGNNICVLDPVCTVTGPAVIDFLGHVGSIQDDCSYKLLSGSTVSGFAVLATFRKRKDVSSLDGVILQLDQPGVHIHLGQGGRVQVENTVLTLSRSALTVHGVQISKTETGVTAEVSHSFLNRTFNTAVFFDGSTAQIFLTGPAGEHLSLGGLCLDSGSLGAMRTSGLSDSSCHRRHSDADDSLIDCPAAECCNLLQGAPFSACHGHADPQPFIAACSSAACGHPEVDGLACRVMEAYVRTCSLRGDVTPEDRRPRVSCGCFHGD